MDFLEIFELALEVLKRVFNRLLKSQSVSFLRIFYLTPGRSSDVNILNISWRSLNVDFLEIFESALEALNAFFNQPLRSQSVSFLRIFYLTPGGP